MKTECSVPQKAVFWCWVLSSSPFGGCITYKSAASTRSCLRNTPVKKLGYFCFFWVVSSGWDFKQLGFLQWKMVISSCTGRTNCEFELDEGEGYICQLVCLLSDGVPCGWSLFWGCPVEVGGTWMVGIGGETRQQQRLSTPNTECQKLESCWVSFFWWWQLPLAPLKGLC